MPDARPRHRALAWRASCAATSKVVHERDPAARGVTSVEILASWPGVHALLTHRVAHTLHEAGVPVVPRAIAYAARAVTGIEIHPARPSATASSSTTATASSSARRPRSATT